MNHDHLDPINALNMPEIADMTFAMDFLVRAKESVRNIATVLTETASPELRVLLRKTLMAALPAATVYHENLLLSHDRKSKPLNT